MSKKTALFIVLLSIIVNFLSACGGSSVDNNAKNLLKDLNIKGRLLVNQPGWVHVTEKIVYDTDTQDRGTLANGTVIPLVQKIDIWYHINSAKRVFEYVWIMSSQAGDTIEVSVFRNNLLYDLMNNSSTALNPYSLKLDYQFADEMDKFIANNGNHPVVTTAVVDGKAATVFTLDGKLASPRTTTDYKQPVNDMGTVAYFDSQSGLLLKLVRTVTLADGTKRIFYTDDLTIETGVQPTQDIQLYLNGFY